ncbi:MAG: hypothetical protein LBV12_10235 [Puniceicoccales bacterium]|jgi:hypothetical protein|nr:hypothetical protein [Puniceicoccales bacterium]
MRTVLKKYPYRVLGIFLCFMILMLFFVSRWISPHTGKALFSDGIALEIKKIDVGIESYAPENFNHKLNRLLIRIGVLDESSFLHKDIFKIDANKSFADFFDVEIPSPSYTGKSLFIWFSISEPTLVVPELNGEATWHDIGFIYGLSISSYANRNPLSLTDEHGCRISSSVLYCLMQNDGKYIFCAEFPYFNRNSRQSRFTANFSKQHSIAFDIHLPASEEKRPTSIPSLPQSIKLPDGVTIHLDKWTFEKSSEVISVAQLTPDFYYQRYFHPKGKPTIRFSKDDQTAIASYGFDVYPIGDAFGSVDDIVCAYSPNWFLRGHAYSTDLSTTPKAQKLIIEDFPKLEEGEVREIPVPANSLFRNAYLLGTGCYFFDVTGVKYNAALDKETEFLDFIAKMKDGTIVGPWDWKGELLKNDRVDFFQREWAFRARKPTVIFSMYPLPSKKKLIASASIPLSASAEFKKISPQLGAAGPSQHTYYDIAIDTSASVEIGLTEKYPFSFFFATDETMQEGAKEILIQK